jgi:hypothetical protein
VLDEKGQSPAGQEPDKLTVDTRYLIVGEPPSDVGADATGINRVWSRMHADALSKGIKFVSVNEFLDYLGYRPQDRTVGLGRNLDPKEFARRPQGTRRALYDVNKHRRITAPNSGPLPGTVKRAIDELPAGMLEALRDRSAGAAPAAVPGGAAETDVEAPAGDEAPAVEEGAIEGDELFPAEDAVGEPE